MNIRRHAGRLAATLALLLAAGAAPAALQIDVLVFSQPAASGEGLAWSVAAPLPPCHAVKLRDGGGAEPAFSGDEACTKKAGYEPVYAGYGTATPSLATAAGKLRSAGQRLLLNRSWRQAGDLSPVLLSGGEDIAGVPEVRGTVAVAGAEKYVEVTLDLVLTRINPASGLPEHVTIREVRKLKSGEPHYLDHPLLGAIVQVIDTDADKKPR